MTQTTCHSDVASFQALTQGANECGVFTTLATRSILPEHAPHFLLDFKLHLLRLESDSKALNLTLPSFNSWIDQLQQALDKHFAVKAYSPAIVKIVLRQNKLDILVADYSNPWTAPIKLKSIRAERYLPAHKSLNLSAGQHARKEALAAGAEEALLCTKTGLITEGAWSNFFWFDLSGTLYTVSSDVLPGVIRSRILNLTPVTERSCALHELLEQAHEAFVTQSTSGITPVSHIDDKTLNGNNFTSKLKSSFESYASKHSTHYLDLHKLR